jgi:hypothetical protein
VGSRHSVLRHGAPQKPPLPACSFGPATAAWSSITSRSNRPSPPKALRTQIKQPLLVTETAEKFDVLATIAGGGIAGQAGALRLGIARALVEYNIELRSGSRRRAS